MKDLVAGSWRLESFDTRIETGEWTLWGPNATGLLIYSPDGFMSVSINKNIESEVNDLNDMLFYAGSFQIRGTEISHAVSNASDLSRVGTTFGRVATISDGRLVLTGASASGK